MKQPIGYRLTFGYEDKQFRSHQDFFSPSAWSDAVRYMKEYGISPDRNPTIGPLYERI